MKNFKKFTIFLLVVALVALALPMGAFAAEETEVVPITKVQITPRFLTIEVGESVALDAAVFPENATYDRLSWSSHNVPVARVANGVVTGMSAGYAHIDVTALNATPVPGGSWSGSCTVTVVPGKNDTKVTGVQLDMDADEVRMVVDISSETGLYFNAAEIPLPEVHVYPEDASDKRVTWSVKDTSIAGVRDTTYWQDGSVMMEGGIYKAFGGFGATTITVTTVDGGFTDSFTLITQKGRADFQITPKVVELDVGEVLINDNRPTEATANEKPCAYINDQRARLNCFHWISDRPEVASFYDRVDQYTMNLLTTHAPGIVNATYTLQGDGALGDSMVFRVLGIAMDRPEATIGATGDGIVLNPTVVLPQDADQTLSWTSSDPTVATVDQTGHVTPVCRGEATIAVSAVEGKYTDSCAITVDMEDVPVPATGIALDKTNTNAILGSTLQLVATPTPTYTTDPLVWTTSDPAIATVDQTGLVTPVADGPCTITVTAGEVSATCKVTVRTGQPGLVFSETELTLQVNDSQQLYVLLDGNPLYDGPTWQSDNASVVKVGNRYCDVNALAVGTATVTAYYNGMTATCKVTVVPVSGYGFQGYDSLGNGNYNTLKLLSPSAITFDEETDTAFFNTIDATLDGDRDIVFGLTMSAGMNNYGDSNFTTYNMPIIKVYNQEMTKVLAEYDGGDGALIYIGCDTEVIPKVISIGVSAGTLPTGSYVLAFGKDLRGNNAAKVIGKDIYFNFDVVSSVAPPAEVPATGITLTQSAATLDVGEALQLAATPQPANTTDAVVWTTSDPAVASVDQTGKVTGLAEGVATITATAGSVSATCALTVQTPEQPHTFVLSQSELTLGVNDTVRIYALYDGEKLEEGPAWSSADESIARVGNRYCDVKGIALGTTTVTGSYNGMLATCTVTVVPATGYGYQGYDSLGNGNFNTMKLLSPDDITFDEETETSFYNTINTPVDGDQYVTFRLTMSAGMNNFQDSTFTTHNMPIIFIYNEDMTELVAAYEDGAGALKYLGCDMESSPRVVSLGVEAGVLKAGKYVLAFGKDLCGNNLTKVIGKDIYFNFEVTGTSPVLQQGDVNGDGKVDSMDALLALRYSVGGVQLQADQIARADMEGDGRVSAMDALAILRLAVSAPTSPFTS